jgi:hypothetical protein
MVLSPIVTRQAALLQLHNINKEFFWGVAYYPLSGHSHLMLRLYWAVTTEKTMDSFQNPSNFYWLPYFNKIGS